MGFQLIWQLKNLFTRQAFGFFLCEVLADLSRAQKPFVVHRRLFPSASLFVFQVVPLLLTFLFLNVFCLLVFPLFLQLAVCFFLVIGRVFIFFLSPCSGFFHRFLFLSRTSFWMLTLDVLLDFPP